MCQVCFHITFCLWIVFFGETLYLSYCFYCDLLFVVCICLWHTMYYISMGTCCLLICLRYILRHLCKLHFNQWTNNVAIVTVVCDIDVFIVTIDPVCTMYHDVYCAYMPVRKGSIVGYTKDIDKDETQWYRVMNSEWNDHLCEWQLFLRDETVKGNPQLKVSITKCKFRFDEDWTQWRGIWLPEISLEKIGQYDGTLTDGENAGVKVLRLLKHIDENVDEIAEEQQYIIQHGIDNLGLPRNNIRFDEKGFATKANDC